MADVSTPASGAVGADRPKGDLAAAQLGIEPVPRHHQVLGFLDFFVLWADLGVGLLVLLAGTYLVPGLSFGAAIAAIVVGTVIGVLLLGMAGAVGSARGVTAMVALRPSFGVRGSYVPSLVNVVQLVGWGAFEVIFMGQASARLATPILGPGTYPLFAALWAGVVILMGLGGPLVVVRQWLEKAGIWIVLVTAGWMLVYAATHLDLGAAVARPGDGSLTFAQGIDLVVVMPVSWLPIVGDFNRFARSTGSAFWGTVIGNGVTNIAFYALGVVLALYLPQGDLVGSILAIAFGAAGLILLLGDESDNAFADVYSAAMSVKNIWPGLPTRWLVAAIGGVALGIALTVNLGQYQSFLYLVGALFVPLYGVLFADYFLIMRGRRTTADYYPEPGDVGRGQSAGVRGLGDRDRDVLGRDHVRAVAGRYAAVARGVARRVPGARPAALGGARLRVGRRRPVRIGTQGGPDALELLDRDLAAGEALAEDLVRSRAHRLRVARLGGGDGRNTGVRRLPRLLGRRLVAAREDHDDPHDRRNEDDEADEAQQPPQASPAHAVVHRHHRLHLVTRTSSAVGTAYASSPDSTLRR